MTGVEGDRLLPLFPVDEIGVLPHGSPLHATVYAKRGICGFIRMMSHKPRMTNRVVPSQIPPPNSRPPALVVPDSDPVPTVGRGTGAATHPIRRAGPRSGTHGGARAGARLHHHSSCQRSVVLTDPDPVPTPPFVLPDSDPVPTVGRGTGAATDATPFLNTTLPISVYCKIDKITQPVRSRPRNREQISRLTRKIPPRLLIKRLDLRAGKAWRGPELH